MEQIPEVGGSIKPLCQIIPLKFDAPIVDCRSSPSSDLLAVGTMIDGRKTEAFREAARAGQESVRLQFLAEITCERRP
jgi:hypothetical protein